jgi:predicted GNAT family N-acyltransferase
MIKVRRIDSGVDMGAAFAIRQKVFVDEQHVDPHLEYDEFEGSSTHYLATIEDLPVGTARWRVTEKGVKLERFAVLEEYRDKGAGTALLAQVLSDADALAKPIYLHAQVQVVPFYEKFGFKAVGDEFVEADIRHYKMIYEGGEKS